ncbi:hypothetical protein K490DRAFT_16240, partial [Saccharata proteae CBS 121410]
LETPFSDALLLTDLERRILQLHDQEQELILEQSLLEEQLKGQFFLDAEREMLNARAAYLLRNRIVENVVITDPVLKAVHAGASASLAERRLLPLVNERDVLAMLHAGLTSKLGSDLIALSKAEQANIAANQKNCELAKTLLDLAERTKTQTTDEFQDARLRAQLEDLDSQLRVSRRRWRTSKGVLSGVIASSGIDWASDEALRELVLDDDD